MIGAICFFDALEYRKPDLIFRDGQIITDATKRASTDQSIKGYKKMLAQDPESTTKLLDKIIKDTYKVLMTRGMKGCYVFCTDDKLRNHIKSIVESV